MVVRRGSDGFPRFAASGFMLASRLAISAGHGFTQPGDSYEVRLPGQSTQRLQVTAVLRHRIDEVDLALLVLREGGPAIPPARWGVLPRTVESVPFIAIGFPDHASRQDVPKTRQLTGAILLGSFLGATRWSCPSAALRRWSQADPPGRGCPGQGSSRKTAFSSACVRATTFHPAQRASPRPTSPRCPEILNS